MDKRLKSIRGIIPGVIVCALLTGCGSFFPEMLTGAGAEPAPMESQTPTQATSATGEAQEILHAPVPVSGTPELPPVLDGLEGQYYNDYLRMTLTLDGQGGCYLSGDGVGETATYAQRGDGTLSLSFSDRVETGTIDGDGDITIAGRSGYFLRDWAFWGITPEEAGLLAGTHTEPEQVAAETPEPVQTVEPDGEPEPVQTVEPVEEPEAVQTVEPTRELGAVQTTEPMEEPEPSQYVDITPEPTAEQTDSPEQEPEPVATAEQPVQVSGNMARDSDNGDGTRRYRDPERGVAFTYPQWMQLETELLEDATAVSDGSGGYVTGRNVTPMFSPDWQDADSFMTEYLRSAVLRDADRLYGMASGYDGLELLHEDVEGRLADAMVTVRCGETELTVRTILYTSIFADGSVNYICKSVFVPVDEDPNVLADLVTGMSAVRPAPSGQS